MKFYESGDSSKPVIFLFPGTCCLYSSFDHILDGLHSYGGSFVSLLIQRKRIHIDHGIIGSSDMDEALFCCHSAEWVEEVRKAVEGDRQ